MNETVRHIAIGVTSDGKPAVTLSYDSGHAHTITFSLSTAKQLSWGLADLCERLSPATGPGDGAAASDGCSISLSPPKEE